MDQAGHGACAGPIKLGVICLAAAPFCRLSQLTVPLAPAFLAVPLSGLQL